MSNKKDLFSSAYFKLTAVYIIIIASISLLFSVWVYSVSMHEIRSNIYRPPGPVERSFLRRDRAFAKEIELKQQESLDTVRRNLIINLIIFNGFVVFGGGALSYFLARRTLRPVYESHQALQRFTSDASHELRTPITAMKTETEVALLDPKLTVKDAKKQLQSNLEELQKLTEISEGLLNLARLDAGFMERTQISVVSLVDSAVERTQKKAREKSQMISVHHHTEEFQVFVEPESIIAAFSTIIDNASKFSPIGSKIAIESQKNKNGKYVEISIRDQGLGISKDDMPHIFDRFYRSDQSRTNSKTEGYGIGLSIAYSSVQKNKGDIHVHSTKKGSVFTIQLPLSHIKE